MIDRKRMEECREWSTPIPGRGGATLLFPNGVSLLDIFSTIDKLLVVKEAAEEVNHNRFDEKCLWDLDEALAACEIGDDEKK